MWRFTARYAPVFVQSAYWFQLVDKKFSIMTGMRHDLAGLWPNKAEWRLGVAMSRSGFGVSGKNLLIALFFMDFLEVF
jgi:hypothetical protein